MTKTDRIARLFRKNVGRFVSSFRVQALSPLGRTQEIARCRQRGLVIEFVRQGKKHGYVCTKAA